MKKLIIAVLAASGAAVAYAQAETSGDRERGGAFRAEMRALIAGDGMKVEDLAALMQERAATRFSALDADSDGVVSRDEFLAAAAERAQGRFERMEPNEDGVVQRSGREGWGRHHRDGPRTERRGGRPRARGEQRARKAGPRPAAGARPRLFYTTPRPPECPQTPMPSSSLKKKKTNNNKKLPHRS